jgi:predicted small lipoprotein YifL
MQRYNLMIKTRVIVLILMAIMVTACGRKGPLHLPVQKPEKTQQTLDEPEKNNKSQKQESK